MGKTIKKEIQKLNKIPHPKSRKTAQLSKKVTKASGKEKSKLKHFMKLNIIGERLLWFRDHLEPVDIYTAELAAKLINSYLSRFDEELEQINIKHSTGKRKGRQHASREDVIKMTIKNEKNEYETCGLEIADILNQQQLNLLKNWSGELRLIQNFKLVRYSKLKLEKTNKSSQQSNITKSEKKSAKKCLPSVKCESAGNQEELSGGINEEPASKCEVKMNNEEPLKMEIDCE